MARQTNLPGKHNPLKATYYNRRPRDPEIEARRAAFWESIKTTSPNLYQKHVRETRESEAERLGFEASLDDPEMIALFEHFTKKMQHDQQNKFTVELGLLGIEAGATKREIRNAYRRKARKLHPDVGGDAEAFRQLYAAYRELLKVAVEK